MEITLRNFRQEFHEKFTLIFAVLKYLQSSKELLKVVDFCCKIHFESLVIHLCLAKLLSALSFFFFDSGKQNEWNIWVFKFISGFTSNIWASSVFWETIMPRRFQLERLLTERSLPRQLQKCTVVLTLRGISTVQPFFQKGYFTPRGRWT